MSRDKFSKASKFVPENWQVHFGSQSMYVSCPNWEGNEYGASTGDGLVHLMGVMGNYDEAIGVAVAQRTVKAVNAYPKFLELLQAAEKMLPYVADELNPVPLLDEIRAALKKAGVK